MTGVFCIEGHSVRVIRSKHFSLCFRTHATLSRISSRSAHIPKKGNFLKSWCASDVVFWLSSSTPIGSICMRTLVPSGNDKGLDKTIFPLFISPSSIIKTQAATYRVLGLQTSFLIEYNTLFGSFCSTNCQFVC